MAYSNTCHPERTADGIIIGVLHTIKSCIYWQIASMEKKWNKLNNNKNKTNNNKTKKKKKVMMMLKKMKKKEEEEERKKQRKKEKKTENKEWKQNRHSFPL